MTSYIACLGRNKASRKSMIPAPWGASWMLSAPCSWCEKQGQGPSRHGCCRSLHARARRLPHAIWAFSCYCRTRGRRQMIWVLPFTLCS